MYKETQWQFKCKSNFTQLKNSEIEVGKEGSWPVWEGEKEGRPVALYTGRPGPTGPGYEARKTST